MTVFFITVLTIYGGLHAYVFFRARGALGLGPAASAWIAAIMFAVVLAPFLIRALERPGFEFAARALAYIAYIWMAAIFLLFCSLLFFDIANLFVRIVAWALRGSGAGTAAVPARPSFFISLMLSLSICVYGWFEALNIRTERLSIETHGLPQNVSSLRIVQISDVHLGLIIRCKRFEKILRVVRAEKPDILVSTGDLVDAQINHLPGLAELLRSVNPRYGKYAITGNHEYYAGLDRALLFTKQAGFTILRGEAVSAGGISIAGVDDQEGVRMGAVKPGDEKALLSGLPKNKFKLLLKHRPVVSREAAGLFDLQLSGHTHKGQIFPFNYMSALSYPMSSGRFSLPGGSVLYVSRGSGTWGPPIRFLSPPEVTVIEIIRKIHNRV